LLGKKLAFGPAETNQATKEDTSLELSVRTPSVNSTFVAAEIKLRSKARTQYAADYETETPSWSLKSSKANVSLAIEVLLKYCTRAAVHSRKTSVTH